MIIWSENKPVEKIDYMHNNPVKRGLVAQPGDCLWSSWRHYYLGHSSVLARDPLQ
jgi:putative transposase